MLWKLLSLLLFDAIDLLLNVYITTHAEGEHLLFGEWAVAEKDRDKKKQR